jgi:hypothetical protein
MYSPDELGAFQAEDDGVLAFSAFYTLPFSRQFWAGLCSKRDQLSVRQIKLSLISRELQQISTANQ